MLHILERDHIEASNEVPFAVSLYPVTFITENLLNYMRWEVNSSGILA